MYKTAQRNEQIRNVECNRTIYVSHLKISTFEFNLTNYKKNKLVQSGWNAIGESDKFGNNNLLEVCPLQFDVTENAV